MRHGKEPDLWRGLRMGVHGVEHVVLGVPSDFLVVGD